MHARLKPVGHRFSYRVMSLLIDLDRLDAANRQSPLFGVNRAALYGFHEADHGKRDGSSLRGYAQALRGRARHRSDRRTRAAVVLSPAARLHLQSAVGLFLPLGQRRTGIDHLRGPQHLWGHPRLCAAGEAGREQRSRYPAATGEAVLRFPLRRDGDALPFSGVAAGRRRQIADPRDRARRPAAVGDLQRPPPRPDHARRCCARSSRCRSSPSRSSRRSTGKRLRLWLKGARLVPRPNDAAANGTLATPNTVLADSRSATTILPRRCLLSGASPSGGKTLWFSEAGI